jgi:hypothetical protein
VTTARTHDSDDAGAEPASGPAPAAAVTGVLGNRSLARLAGAGGSAAAAVGAVVAGHAPTSNRARARMLSRIVHEDGVIDERTRSYTPQSSSLRDAIMENGASLVPATEGEQKFYAGVDKASIDKGREWAAGRGTTYTDCIDFAIRRLAIGLAKVGKKAKLPSPVFPDASPAFVKAYKGMPPDLRPSPGDIFVMHSGTAKDTTADSGNFAHTGVIKELATSGGDGVEQWTSYDGGQGAATKLQHLEVSRTYHPDTNMYGGKVLYGWIDADLV